MKCWLLALCMSDDRHSNMTWVEHKFIFIEICTCKAQKLCFESRTLLVGIIVDNVVTGDVVLKINVCIYFSWETIRSKKKWRMRLKFPYACFFTVYIVRVIADIWQNNRKHLRHYFETWNINFHCHFIYVNNYESKLIIRFKWELRCMCEISRHITSAALARSLEFSPQFFAE